MASVTLADIARRLGGDQPILVDALTNPQASVTFGRLPMRQITGWIEPFTRIEGRPTVYWRKLGEYITPQKSNRNPYNEGVFLLSGASEVDKIRADRDPRGALTLRAEEDWSFLESLGYSLSLQLFYGGTSLASDTDSFDGICARIPSTASTYQLASAGSAGCSVYAFKLGAGAFMGLYNTGPSGKLIDATDYGAVIDKDSSSNLNELYRTFFNAAFGIAQYHELCIGRLSQVNYNAATPIAATDFTALYGKMQRKPDIFVTTWNGWGAISALLSGKQVYAPGQTDYAPYVGSYDGVPIIVDSALVDDVGM